MAQGTATSFAVPNFSGMLFAKGQTATPFSTMIGARPLVREKWKRKNRPQP